MFGLCAFVGILNRSSQRIPSRIIPSGLPEQVIPNHTGKPLFEQPDRVSLIGIFRPSSSDSISDGGSDGSGFSESDANSRVPVVLNSFCFFLRLRRRAVALFGSGAGVTSGLGWSADRA